MELSLSIIVVTYNCQDYIIRFLKELTESLEGYSGYEILLNDNSSTDETYLLCKSFAENKGLTYLKISQSANIGFAKANNLLIKKSNYKNLLLLNPDVFDFAKNFWSKLFSVWDGINPLLITLLNTDQTIQDTTVEELSIKSEFKRLPGVNLLKKNITQITPDMAEVESGIMAFFLLTADCCKKTGYISEKYHMYSEDRDFCYKVRRKGYVIKYTNALKLTHTGGGSAKKTWDTREILMIKNQSDRLFIKENYKGAERYFLLFTNFLRKIIYLYTSKPVKKSIT